MVISSCSWARTKCVVFVLRRGVTVDAVGRPLCATWPPDDLDLLLEQLRWKAGAGYGYTESEGAPEEYTSPLLNDLDAFLSQFLG